MSVQDRVTSGVNESGTCAKIDTPLTQAGSRDVHRHNWSTVCTEWRATLVKRIESDADMFRGTVTYQLDDRRYLTLDARTVREHGQAKVLRAYGVEVTETERVPVMQYGRRVGTVPGDFDLSFARSRSPFYDVRPGDLTRNGDVWVAARNLGASDLDCLVGFQRDEGHEQRQQEIRDETLAALSGQPSRA